MKLFLAIAFSTLFSIISINNKKTSQAQERSIINKTRNPSAAETELETLYPFLKDRKGSMEEVYELCRKHQKLDYSHKYPIIFDQKRTPQCNLLTVSSLLNPFIKESKNSISPLSVLSSFSVNKNMTPFNTLFNNNEAGEFLEKNQKGELKYFSNESYPYDSTLHINLSDTIFSYFKIPTEKLHLYNIEGQSLDQKFINIKGEHYSYQLNTEKLIKQKENKIPLKKYLENFSIKLTELKKHKKTNESKISTKPFEIVYFNAKKEASLPFFYSHLLSTIIHEKTALQVNLCGNRLREGKLEEQDCIQHTFLVTGFEYRNNECLLKVQNSWGKDWKSGGRDDISIKKFTKLVKNYPENTEDYLLDSTNLIPFKGAGNLTIKPFNKLILIGNTKRRELHGMNKAYLFPELKYYSKREY